MNAKPLDMAGRLVEIPLPSRRRPLDGFLVEGDRRMPLLVFVHGMHSNFYRSVLKKSLMTECRRAGFAMLSFNNRGAEDRTNDERFRDCLADLDAALRFARKRGYHSFVLAGHSTGCQKITYHQALRRDPAVKGLVLLAIGDDLAIVRRDLGGRFAAWVRRARAMVRRGKGREPLGAPRIPPFSARRFLSIADPSAVEARLFDLESGRLDHFRRLRCAVFTVLAGADEYETMPAAKVLALLNARYRGPSFGGRVLSGANHGFHGAERVVAREVVRWIAALQRATSTGRAASP